MPDCAKKKARFTNRLPTGSSLRKSFGRNQEQELTLREVLDICRQCHKLAPFCFYNGNTFAAIGRTIVQDLLKDLPPTKAHNLRSVVGHYIAGTVEAEEIGKALEIFS